MIVIQIILYCLLFTLMVKYAVRGGAVNGLYFYPEPVRERAFAIGLADRETTARKRNRFMTLFYVVMTLALTGIIAVWNKVRDFHTAYLQALLFLQVMNWYDGIVIDKIWVARSSFWLLPGTEDLPYVRSWSQVLKKRVLLSLIWIAGAAVIAGIVVMIFAALERG